MKNEKKAIMPHVKKVMSTIQDMSKSLSNVEAYMLAIRVLMVVKKVSKGIMTESEALGYLTGNAKIVVISEGISIASSLLISILKQVEKSKKKLNKDDEYYDNDITDLDDEKEYESFIGDDDDELSESKADDEGGLPDPEPAV